MSLYPKPFRATDSSLFYSSNDPKDTRLGDLFFQLNSSDHADFSEKMAMDESILLLGYPDQEGLGKGAKKYPYKEASRKIRRSLYRHCPPAFFSEKERFVDIGDLTSEGSLQETHQKVETFAKTAFEKGHKWVSLGGTYNYALADIRAFLRTHEEGLVFQFTPRPCMRKSEEEGSYATNYFLGDEFEARQAMIGLQYSNTPKESYQALESADNWRMIFSDELLHSSLGLNEMLLRECESWLYSQKPAFIAVDMNVLSIETIGPSYQSTAMGLEFREFLKTLLFLQQRLKVVGFGLYNVNAGEKAALQIAADLVYRFLYKLS